MMSKSPYRGDDVGGFVHGREDDAARKPVEMGVVVQESHHFDESSRGSQVVHPSFQKKSSDRNSSHMHVVLGVSCKDGHACGSTGPTGWKSSALGQRLAGMAPRQ